MHAFLRVLRDIGLMLARIVVGVVLLARGWHRWQVAGIAEEVSLMESAGIPSATTLIWLVIGFEIIGGILLVFGLATPLIGFGMIALNVGIIVLLRADEGFYVHEHGWEYNAVQAVMGLIFLTHGSGRAGLDSLFTQPKDDRQEELIVEDADPTRIQTREY
ncbi:DoxX family protein [Tessaracoccus sp. OS52]|uniref:DoxX family protein n=1 Tax=Tessaracoccus sp. OS52 TaxID=2886691 RepID=UPI001D10E88D|nr:DoxX family protein [Tessaracoccus sp. OS52]MCC2594476.1 DoxX family protein [Tessaracoccus sp. OS52]